MIVNADDYAFFNCVSRGIRQTIRAGSVTATGLMANSPNLAGRISELCEIDARFDVGVHLNLSLGTPVTPEMQRHVARWNGAFPGKFTVIGAVLTRSLPLPVVRDEWRAQIERCLEHGVVLRFLNSHEHLHALPRFVPLVRRLAKEYQVPFVRHVSADPLTAVPPHGLIRNMILSGLSTMSPTPYPGSPRLVGLGSSGKLTRDYLERRLPLLRKGKIYELMCHPGEYDPNEITDSYLTRYHDWEAELRLLTGPDLKTLCEENDVRVITYGDLLSEDDHLPRSTSVRQTGSSNG